VSTVSPYKASIPGECPSVTTGQAYDETICAQNEKHNRWRLELKLRKQARELGFEVVAAKPVAI
jgi:hypothetical protein